MPPIDDKDFPETFPNGIQKKTKRSTDIFYYNFYYYFYSLQYYSYTMTNNNDSYNNRGKTGEKGKEVGVSKIISMTSFASFETYQFFH